MCSSLAISEGSDCALTCTDTVGSIHQNHWDGRHVEFRLDLTTVFNQVIEEGVIGWMEDGASHPWKCREDVTSAGRVFPALHLSDAFHGMTHRRSSTELTAWFKEVDVVGTDKVLSKPDDRGCQTLLSVMVRGLLRDVSRQLSHLDLCCEVTFETPKEDLSLTGFQTIRHGRNRTDVVGH